MKKSALPAAAETAREQKPGPKIQPLRQDVQAERYSEFPDFIDSLGPRRSVHRALGITYVTLMRRLREPATLTIQELYNLAEISGNTMGSLLKLLQPYLKRVETER
ncbi:hypothetical protein KLP40_14700 [Hymenobacter sp. NST-14]|uniref:hypothetical protein n=1 Tax=Hymenobacter piscis TaxID=2839984 RepID=UPI001C02A0FA|nr:hypothetical protein [Hymenobacter piscis]MBT9394418.1 hypothetical protein [Hymenobacter piscis]